MSCGIDILTPPFPSGGSSSSGSSTPEYTLRADSSVTATTVRITPKATFLHVGLWVRIDVWTLDCETRPIAGVTQGTDYTDITIGALAYAHATGDIVHITADPTASALHYGAVAGGAAGTNTSAFNRMFAEANLQSFKATTAPAGTFLVNNELRIPQEVSFTGVGIQTVIAADDTFVATDNEKAIVHQYRDGSPVVYSDPGPTGRIYLKNFLIDGRNVAGGVNGLLESQQQPQFRENSRVQNCTGYGIATVDTQQLIARNTEILNCKAPWIIRSCGFIWSYDLNIEQTLEAGGDYHLIFEIQDGSGGNYAANFINVHMEGDTLSGVAIRGTGFQGSFKNVWLSAANEMTVYQFDGDSSYDIQWTRISGTVLGSTMLIDDNDNATIDAFTEHRGVMVHYAKGLRQSSPAVGWTFSANGPEDAAIPTSLCLGPHGTVGAAFIRAIVATGLGIQASATSGTGFRGEAMSGKAFQAVATGGGYCFSGTATGGSLVADFQAADDTSLALRTRGGIIEVATAVNGSTYTVIPQDSHLKIYTVPCIITLRAKDVCKDVRLVIEDCTGSASIATPITIATIDNALINGVNGTTTPVNLTTPYMAVDVESDFNEFYLHTRIPGPSVPSGMLGSIAYSKLNSATLPGLVVTLLSEYVPPMFAVPAVAVGAASDLGSTLWARFDTTSCQEIKLAMSVTALTAAATFNAQYSSDGAATWHFFNAAGNGPQVAISSPTFAGNHAVWASTWTTIDAGGKGDIYIRIVGWDGAPSSVTINKIDVHLR